MTVSPESSGNNAQGLEKESKLAYGLSEQQDVFLFGDQGVIPNDWDSFLVSHYKMGFAREWLAQFVPISDVPQEFIDNKNESDSIVREYFKSEPETFGVVKPHPLAKALHDEQNSQRPFADRPVLSTTLLYAEDALTADPEAKEKMEYVLALFEEYDRHLTNSGRQGGDTSPERFPQPIPSYGNKNFPAQLCGSEMLF